MKRLPIGLTIAVATSLVILIALGTWQLQRLAWKTQLLAEIAAARTAAPVGLDEILRRQSTGQSIEWRRVRISCLPAGQSGQVLVYGVTDGEIAWRLVSPCRPAERPDRTIALERGILLAARGVIEPAALTAPPAQSAIAIVRLPEGLPPGMPGVNAERIPGGYRMPRRDKTALGLVGSPDAPAIGGFYLSVENETPQPPELRPAPTPPDIPNRHLEYALTWFGLAGALLAIYAAMLWRRFKV